MGIVAGLLSLYTAPSAWFALAPFVLAIWVSPAPIVTGGMVTLILMAAGALSIMGRLPNGIHESFAIGSGMALSWITTLVMRAKHRHPTESLHGVRNIIESSLTGMMLVNDSGAVLLINQRMRELLGLAEPVDNKSTTFITELLDCKPLLKFLASDKQTTEFEQKPQPVRSIASSKFCLLYTSPSPRDATLSRMPSSA